MIKKTAKESAFVVVWEFRIRAGKRREFERVYGSKGVWAKFFRRGEGYIGTELLRDPATPRRYLTIDLWASRAAFLRLKKENRGEYQAIDEKCAWLTESEVLIGEFHSSTWLPDRAEI